MRNKNKKDTRMAYLTKKIDGQEILALVVVYALNRGIGCNNSNWWSWRESHPRPQA